MCDDKFFQVNFDALMRPKDYTNYKKVLEEISEITSRRYFFKTKEEKETGANSQQEVKSLGNFAFYIYTNILYDLGDDLKFDENFKFRSYELFLNNNGAVVDIDFTGFFEKFERENVERKFSAIVKNKQYTFKKISKIEFSLKTYKLTISIAETYYNFYNWYVSETNCNKVFESIRLWASHDDKLHQYDAVKGCYIDNDSNILDHQNNKRSFEIISEGYTDNSNFKRQKHNETKYFDHSMLDIFGDDLIDVEYHKNDIECFSNFMDSNNNLDVVKVGDDTSNNIEYKKDSIINQENKIAVTSENKIAITSEKDKTKITKGSKVKVVEGNNKIKAVKENDKKKENLIKEKPKNNNKQLKDNKQSKDGVMKEINEEILSKLKKIIKKHDNEYFKSLFSKMNRRLVNFDNVEKDSICTITRIKTITKKMILIEKSNNDKKEYTVSSDVYNILERLYNLFNKKSTKENIDDIILKIKNIK
jgi:hypothetical protein